MSPRVALTKMHGALNDFVILDCRAAPIDGLADFARWACDRRSGVGADGLIAIAASTSGIAMRTLNADGSEAEMCGNGIRCAARWLDEAGEGDRMTFETPAGTIRTEIVERGREYLVRVAIPPPRGRARRVSSMEDAMTVDLGNPHLVLFRQRVDAVDLETVAPALQRHPLFAQGTNVHVAAVEGTNTLRLRHWERGVGLTMACGTGAVAAAAAAIESGRVTSPVEAVVPGGRLLVEWNGSGDVSLTGPAVRVFDTDVAA